MVRFQPASALKRALFLAFPAVLIAGVALPQVPEFTADSSRQHAERALDLLLGEGTQ